MTSIEVRPCRHGVVVALCHDHLKSIVEVCRTQDEAAELVGELLSRIVSPAVAARGRVS
jgi:hypothetical protein